MPFIPNREGTQLFYNDWGHGTPVVFVSAWALNGRMWDYQVPAFIEAGFRSVTFDRRGHGRSDCPGDGYDLDTFADDVARVLDTLDLSGVTLIGHSMGGAEIVRYLSRYGASRISRLVLSAAVTPGALKSPSNPDGIDESVFQQSLMAMRKDLGGWLDVTGVGYWGAEFGPDAFPLMTAWTKQSFFDVPLHVLLETQKAFMGADFSDELRNINVPTLVIHGSADLSAPLALTGARTAALVPGARLSVIEGAGHGFYFSYAERWNNDVLAFIRESPAPQP